MSDIMRPSDKSDIDRFLREMVASAEHGAEGGAPAGGDDVSPARMAEIRTLIEAHRRRPGRRRGWTWAGSGIGLLAAAAALAVWTRPSAPPTWEAPMRVAMQGELAGAWGSPAPRPEGVPAFAPFSRVQLDVTWDGDPPPDEVAVRAWAERPGGALVRVHPGPLAREEGPEGLRLTGLGDALFGDGVGDCGLWVVVGRKIPKALRGGDLSREALEARVRVEEEAAHVASWHQAARCVGLPP